MNYIDKNMEEASAIVYVINQTLGKLNESFQYSLN
jgi:hypothetical protein